MRWPQRSFSEGFNQHSQHHIVYSLVQCLLYDVGGMMKYDTYAFGLTGSQCVELINILLMVLPGDW